jgi:hypothetical protein
VQNILSEVHSVLNFLGEDYITKLPSEIWANIESNRNIQNNPVIDSSKPLNEQGLQEDTLAFLFVLKRDYFCDTYDEQQAILKIFEDNQKEWNEKVMNSGSLRAALKMLKNN